MKSSVLLAGIFALVLSAPPASAQMEGHTMTQPSAQDPKAGAAKK